jgi:hypothetical protein
MTKHELVDKSIGLTFDFIRYVLDKPKMLDQIPEGAEVDFIDTGTASAVGKSVTGSKKPRVALKVERTFRAA